MLAFKRIKSGAEFVADSQSPIHDVDAHPGSCREGKQSAASIAVFRICQRIQVKLFQQAVDFGVPQSCS